MVVVVVVAVSVVIVTVAAAVAVTAGLNDSQVQERWKFQCSSSDTGGSLFSPCFGSLK